MSLSAKSAPRAAWSCSPNGGHPPANDIRVTADVVWDPGHVDLSHVLAREIGHQVECPYLGARRLEFMASRERDPKTTGRVTTSHGRGGVRRISPGVEAEGTEA